MNFGAHNCKAGNLANKIRRTWAKCDCKKCNYIVAECGIFFSAMTSENDDAKLEISMFESCTVTHVACMIASVLHDPDKFAKYIGWKDSRLYVLYARPDGGITVMESIPSIIMNIGLPVSSFLGDLMQMMSTDTGSKVIVVRSENAYAIVVSLKSKLVWLNNCCNMHSIHSLNLPVYNDQIMEKLSCVLGKRSNQKFLKMKQLNAGTSSWITTELDEQQMKFKTGIEDRHSLGYSIFLWTCTPFLSDDNPQTKVLQKNLERAKKNIVWKSGNIERVNFSHSNLMFEIWAVQKDDKRLQIEHEIMQREFPGAIIQSQTLVEKLDIPFVYLVDLMSTRVTGVCSQKCHDTFVLQILRVIMLGLACLASQRDHFTNRPASEFVFMYFDTYFTAHWARIKILENIISSYDVSLQIELAAYVFDLLISLMDSDGTEMFKTFIRPPDSFHFLTASQRFVHIYGFFMRMDLLSSEVVRNYESLMKLIAARKLSSLFPFHNVKDTNSTFCCDFCETQVGYMEMRKTHCIPCTACYEKLVCENCAICMTSKKVRCKMCTDKEMDTLEMHLVKWR